MLERVFIVRHGETDYNVTGRWQGHLDTPLNANGREQARRAATALKHFPIQAVYASPLSRAEETARIIAKTFSLEVQQDTRWMEINVGIFQGLTSKELAETYPLEYTYWQHNDDFIVPQGESRRQLQARVLQAWQDLLASEAQSHAVIVSHGGTIRHLLLRLFGEAPLLGRRLDNTCISTLERSTDGAWQLARFADTSHLE